MIDSLNRSYMNADYRNHRSNLLVEREISRLPESMQLAANETKARDCDKAVKEKDEQIAALRAQMRTLEIERRGFLGQAWNLRNPDKEANKLVSLLCHAQEKIAEDSCQHNTNVRYASFTLVRNALKL